MTHKPDISHGELVITRTFRAPRALIWQAFTQAEHLNHWWGPQGAAIKTKTLDVRPGGIFHYSMTGADGKEMWGKFTYEEVDEPNKLVFINSFSDAEGGITKNPWMPTWPLQVHNTMTLEEKDGGTLLTIRGGPINASEEELKTFEGGRAGMQQGFAGTFEQLDAYLASL
jgi:uncharacterized protein YndB with AHSA1/START domain